MPIEDLCFRDAPTISKDTTLEEAAVRMKDGRVGALIVTDRSQRGAGIVTDRDIVLGGVAAKKPMSAKVHEVMSHDVLQVSRETGNAEVIEMGNELNSLGRLVSRQESSEGMAESA